MTVKVKPLSRPLAILYWVFVTALAAYAGALAYVLWQWWHE